MTDLASRILALFPSDGSTELTRQAIVKSLALGPMQTNKVYRALKTLVAEDVLIEENDFGNPGVIYSLPQPSISDASGPASRPNEINGLEDDFASKAIILARRSKLIDEAVRRVRKLRWRYYEDIIWSAARYPDFYWKAFPATIAAIRAEFHKLAEERA